MRYLIIITLTYFAAFAALCAALYLSVASVTVWLFGSVALWTVGIIHIGHACDLIPDQDTPETFGH